MFRIEKSMILHLIKHGTIEDIKTAHKQGADIHMGMKEYSSYTLMHAAAERRYTSKEEALEIISYLRDQKLDINARHLIPDIDGEVSCLQETPLFKAVQELNFYAIEALIELGADVNCGFTKRGQSLFYY